MMLRRMDLGSYTVHGFRSGFRDWAGDETPFPREIAEAALAHRVGDATERAYRRADALERRRQLMQAWADYCCNKKSTMSSHFGERLMCQHGETNPPKRRLGFDRVRIVPWS